MRSCDHLGICQHRATPCPGCKLPPKHYFAPGAVEHYEPPRSPVWAALRSAALPVGLVAVCFALSVFLGLAAGYFHG